MRTSFIRTARRAVVRRSLGQRDAEVITRPAPIGGWNARDSLALMKKEDAVRLDNFFPGESQVDLRRGFTQHATGVGSGAVETIAEYNSTTSRKLIVAGGGKIYDATSAGAATSKATGFSVNRWQWVNMNALLGMVNGTDAPQEYNGTTVSAMTISGSGLTVANLIGINVFKSRSYFWEKDSEDFWYSAVNALGGTLTKFPLSRVGTLGGNLSAMTTWTLDGGDGVDDLAVFIKTSGEVIVYQGSNPGDAAAWALVGVFRIGAPLSTRGVLKFGGDVIVMTKDGYVPLGKILQLGRVGNVGAISNKIAPAVVEAAQKHVLNYGWQPTLYSRGNMILFNVPVSTVTFHQHVVNTITGAWCRFKGWNGNTFGTFNDDLYFGGLDGTVNKADNSTADGGADIIGDAETAFDYMGSPSVLKTVTALAPVLAAGGSVSFGIGAQADFRSELIPNDTYNFTSSVGGEDIHESITANFEDCTIIMESASADIVRKWISAKADGYAIGARLSIATQKTFQWHAINYLVRKGVGI